MQTILKAVDDSTVAIIPEDLLSQLGWETGDNLEVQVEDAPCRHQSRETFKG